MRTKSIEGVREKESDRVHVYERERGAKTRT